MELRSDVTEKYLIILFCFESTLMHINAYTWANISREKTYSKYYLRKNNKS